MRNIHTYTVDTGLNRLSKFPEHDLKGTGQEREFSCFDELQDCERNDLTLTDQG